MSEAFRIRARRFPALVTCTSIDWFHPWPTDALLSVGRQFLHEIELDDEVRDGIERFMPFSFQVVSVSKSSEGAAREWSTVVIVIVIFIS